MSTILCATRGGEASYHTQDHAIAIAKERDASLLFIFVADVDFLSRTRATIVVDVETEIEHMGEFLLLMAKERAEKAGIQAESVVKHGSFRHAMKETAREYGVDLVVFGRPGEETAATQIKYLQNLSQELADELGVETVIV